jgi:hypothetical protein
LPLAEDDVVVECRRAAINRLAMRVRLVCRPVEIELLGIVGVDPIGQEAPLIVAHLHQVADAIG